MVDGLSSAASDSNRELEFVEHRALLSGRNATQQQPTAGAARTAATTQRCQQQLQDRRKSVIILLVLVVLGCFLYNSETVNSTLSTTTTTDPAVEGRHNSNNNNLAHNNNNQQRHGVDINSMLNFINESASKMYYPDNFPDLLFVLKQIQVVQKDDDNINDDDDTTATSMSNNSQPTATTKNVTQYVLLQSMNTYWKQAHPFRKHQLGFNQQFLLDAVQILNRNVPSLLELNGHNDNENSSNYLRLHQRIHDAGGSMPFYTNWKLHLNTNLTQVICPDKNRNSKSNITIPAIPIFQRALPVGCFGGNGTTDATLYNDYDYWTIPTSSILQQLEPQFGIWTSRTSGKQHRAVVIAVPAVDPSALLPPFEVDITNKTIHSLRQKAENKYLSEQLVFLSENDKDKAYDKYTAVLDIDRTSSLYPSLLCQTSVLLKRYPPDDKNGGMDALSNILQAWVHFVPVQNDWSDLERKVKYVLNPKNSDEMDAIVENANAWCNRYKNKEYMTNRFLESLKTLIERLDMQNPSWTQLWEQKREDYLKGHWLRQAGSDSWSLPKKIVGEIKHSGLRADDPRVEDLW